MNDQQTEPTNTGISYSATWSDAAEASSDEQARQRLEAAWSKAKPEQRRTIANALAKTVAIVRDGAPVAEWRSLEEMAMSIAPGITYARRRDATRAISAGKRGVS